VTLFVPAAYLKEKVYALTIRTPTSVYVLDLEFSCGLVQYNLNGMCDFCRSMVKVKHAVSLSEWMLALETSMRGGSPHGTGHARCVSFIRV
jgi:hypothetical protein